jgi:hypothetical protein
MKWTLAALLLAGAASAAPITPVVSGQLSATSSAVSLPVDGQNGFSVSITAGLVGTVKVQTSFDRGVTWMDEPAAGPLFLATTSTVVTVSAPLPGGATNVQAIVTTWNQGRSTATLRASASAGPPRATASGTLAATGDTVTLPVDPSRWAGVQFAELSGTFIGQVAFEYSIDNGTNWLLGPYIQQTYLVSANFSVYTSLLGSGGTVAGTAYTQPLPGNATHVRIRGASVTGGPSAWSLTPGRPLVPGVPVLAVLYDVTSAVNTAIDTGVFETSGWNQLLWYASSSGTPAISTSQVDDAGVGALNFTSDASLSAGNLGIGTLKTAAGNTSGSMLPRRWKLTSGAIVAGTSRIRIEARR